MYEKSQQQSKNHYFLSSFVLSRYAGFTALFNGEPYKNKSAPGSPSKGGAGASGGDAISANPFRPGAPMKKSVGPGDYYGTLGGPILHVAENPPVPRKRASSFPSQFCSRDLLSLTFINFDSRLRSRVIVSSSSLSRSLSFSQGDFQLGPPNIKTNPAKKGTYGYIMTTLSERAGAEGIAQEYRYVADPYCERKTKQSVQDSKDKHVSDNPFRPVSGFKKFKPGMVGRTTGEPYPYVEEGPSKKEPLPPLERPFRPSHPPKSGVNATLDKFPEYVEDPIPAKLQAAKEARKKERELLGTLPPWRAGSGKPKTGATPSILRLNL